MPLARICTGARCHTSRARLLLELGWQNLAERLKYFKLVAFYKMFHRLYPDYLSDMVPQNTARVNGRPLRYGHTFASNQIPN